MLPLTDFKISSKSYQPAFAQNDSGGNLLFDWGAVGKVKVRVLIVAALVLTSLFATQLVFAASLSTDGQRLAKIEEEIARRESENANLKTEIARESSLSNLSQKAKSLGFTDTPKIIAP